MIGQPTTRVDGPVKVTGRATYAYEYWQDDPRSTGWLSRRRSVGGE